MTRQEFIDDVKYWDELIEFCSDNECDYCNDIYNSEAWNDCIDDDVSEMARNNGWRDILDTLQEYNELSGFAYYRRTAYRDWVGLDDDDFDAYKDDVCEWMDRNGCWDEDEEEDEEEEVQPTPYANPEDSAPLDAEDVSLDDLLLSGIEALKASQNTVSDEADFNSLLFA